MDLTSKIEIRKQLRSQSWVVADDELSELKDYLNYFLKNQSGIWASYMPLADEPEVSECMKHNNHIQWVYPRVEDGKLSFYKLEGNQVDTSTYGVREPHNKPECKVQTEQLSGLLIPALAFSSQGVRLGRGKGYYDRTLEKFNNKKVGICFKHQLYEVLPAEAHDVKVDIIVTAGGVIHCLQI